MRFRPRHYVLIAIILALGVYNIVRHHRSQQPLTKTPAAIPATVGPVPQSPAWQAFDKVAALRDAPDAQFQPALQALNEQILTAPNNEKADLNGCHVWLLYYRESARHASANDSWKQRSTEHLNTCVSQHRDVSS